MASTVCANGWICVDISPDHESRAKKIRHDRDQRYLNIFLEYRTDERWVGDLGEMVFNSWLSHKCIRPYEWIITDVAGKPDFIISPNVSVSVKTVKRKVPPKIDFTAQVTAKHASEPVDHIFFMTYEIEKRKMWLLGGIKQEVFLSCAKYYGAGEQVHGNYIIRSGHEIYNVSLSELKPPESWLEDTQRYWTGKETFDQLLLL